jgi:phosphoribosyl-ATP pyrophosphohydrolase/phosphoribosyl-AMP cyclohydrolase
MNTIRIDFKKMNGLVPAVIQDSKTKEIYMLGFMNEESMQKTIDTGFIYFWSRSRQKLWMKGEESGNKLKVEEIYLDCDGDTLLVKVTLIGNVVCHSGMRTCFNEKLLINK